MKWRGVSVLWVLSLAHLSCASETKNQAEAQSPSVTEAPAVQSQRSTIGGGFQQGAAQDWNLSTHRDVMLRSQNLVLSLPQGQSWNPMPRRGTWSGLRHDASESEVWVRHVQARRTVTVEECEREARLSWPLIREATDSAAERPLHAPADYGGRLSVILLPDGGGRVEAFSVGVSRCLAVVFTTGGLPGFPERLRVGVNEVVETMRVPRLDERSGIGPALPY